MLEMYGASHTLSQHLHGLSAQLHSFQSVVWKGSRLIIKRSGKIHFARFTFLPVAWLWNVDTLHEEGAQLRPEHVAVLVQSFSSFSSWAFKSTALPHIFIRLYDHIRTVVHVRECHVEVHMATVTIRRVHGKIYLLRNYPIFFPRRLVMLHVIYLISSLCNSLWNR